MRDLLGRVKAPDGPAAQVPPEKVVELAAAVSRGAAVSSLGEIYPRDMEPLRTLKLAQGAGTGNDDLTVEEFNARVGERYPKAARLPDRPYLDDLLKDAGLDFEWNPAARSGKGAYINKLREQIRSSTGSSSLTRSYGKRAGGGGSAGAVGAGVRGAAGARQRTGAFLAIAVGTAKMLKAEKEIANRFHVRRISIDQLLIRAMRAAAEKAEIKWPVISVPTVRNAAAATGATCWRLVKRAMPAVKAAIEEAGREQLCLSPSRPARALRSSRSVELDARAGGRARRIRGALGADRLRQCDDAARPRRASRARVHGGAMGAHS